jgi:hypothetical protein
VGRIHVVSSLFITDQRVRWEPADDDAALLVVPFGERQERSIARFDPKTGMLHLMESMLIETLTAATKPFGLIELWSGMPSAGALSPRSARSLGLTRALPGQSSALRKWSITWMGKRTFGQRGHKTH